MSKAMPAHLTYAEVVLRYLIGIKGRKLTWSGKHVSLPHVIGEILAYVDSSWSDDKNKPRSSMAYYFFFVNNATFSWRETISENVVLSTIEAEILALASCCCEVVWARKLAVELGFLLKPIDFTKTTPVVLPWQTTCIYVGAASILPFVCASFSNSFKTE